MYFFLVNNFITFSHILYAVTSGGVISPVHDGYQKSSLIPAKHRLAMARLAVTRETEPEPWVRVSDWETKQVHMYLFRI